MQLSVKILSTWALVEIKYLRKRSKRYVSAYPSIHTFVLICMTVFVTQMSYESPEAISEST